MNRNVRKIFTTLTAFLALLGSARASMATGYEEPIHPAQACPGTLATARG